ncbi:MAG: LPS export ABC transporter periplasmic protein LptC [Cyanobacteria bacterium SIG29]|nr:LPS export ABC transporter periplasmic protein LptC [Cyanobacteria bacterium SIG29]
MALKNLFKSKRNIAYIVLLAVIIIACTWAFISASMITKIFKTKIEEQTFKNKEANIENLLVTETKDGEKLWEMFAETGRYSDNDSIVFLEGIIGNFYEDKKVKASFKADRGTYHSEKKEIILYSNVVLVYNDGTNIMTDRISYLGKGQDIVAQGSVRIEKPKEAIIYGGKAILKGDFSDFHIEGRTQTKFYM